MKHRLCVRCRKPYLEAIDGVVNAARSYAPFCSKRCADVDLVHWLKGDYALDDDGKLALVEAAEDIPAKAAPREDDGA